GLEKVGGHTGTVTHVVSNVVGDGRRVAGVIFGDPLLNLADQVGTDVSGLGENATTDPEEEGKERPTETETDQDGRGGVLEGHDDDRGAEQTETHSEHPGDATGPEGDLEAGGE